MVPHRFQGSRPMINLNWYGQYAWLFLGLSFYPQGFKFEIMKMVVNLSVKLCKSMHSHVLCFRVTMTRLVFCARSCLQWEPCLNSPHTPCYPWISLEVPSVFIKSWPILPPRIPSYKYGSRRRRLVRFAKLPNKIITHVLNKVVNNKHTAPN